MLDKAQALADELVRLRRDIHAHPELGFEEVRTAALVADTLSEIGGFEVKTGVGRTGVTAQIGSGEGPTIGLRADMDALPIQEINGTDFDSTRPGIMHACGHDAHTAMLLGVAHLLRQSFAEEQWQGNVRLLFQPSEERFDDQGVSGATAMLADAAMADVDHVIALHVKSDRPAGEIRIHDEYSLAAVDSFEAWIFGDGGHGAYPHTGVDPLFILSSVLPALYGIPSRRINPLRESVVSLGRINGGEINNVIPNRVQLLGTIRSYDPDVRQQLWREVENALRISEMMGGRYEFKLSKGYPSLYNDPTVNTWLAGTARDLVDPAQVIYTEYGMGAEDFAYMAQKAPGAMFMLGAAIPDGKVRTHHTDTFDIDESVLPIGSAILAETARRYVTGRLG
ncbi:MAG: amidohydrolase [Anaerolineales bacterium]|nr:amidohydrolase [Anaerolineales bacterium]